MEVDRFEWTGAYPERVVQTELNKSGLEPPGGRRAEHFDQRLEEHQPFDTERSFLRTLSNVKYLRNNID
jgi:hypothetical protein